MKEETAMNGRTANIPGDSHMMSSPKSPKSPTSQAVVEKRNSLRHNHQQEIVMSGGREKEHREHMNGAKVVGNHYNNNSKVNSACLNNLILPLLSEVCLTMGVVYSYTHALIFLLHYFRVFSFCDYYYIQLRGNKPMMKFNYHRSVL